MRDKNRIEPFCSYLAHVWKVYFPDWRFGQFIMNFLSWYGLDPFYLEDDKFQELLDEYVTEYRKVNRNNERMDTCECEF